MGGIFSEKKACGNVPTSSGLPKIRTKFLKIVFTHEQLGPHSWKDVSLMNKMGPSSQKQFSFMKNWDQIPENSFHPYKLGPTSKKYCSPMFPTIWRHVRNLGPGLKLQAVQTRSTRYDPGGALEKAWSCEEKHVSMLPTCIRTLRPTSTGIQKKRKYYLCLKAFKRLPRLFKAFLRGSYPFLMI